MLIQKPHLFIPVICYHNAHIKHFLNIPIHHASVHQLSIVNSKNFVIIFTINDVHASTEELCNIQLCLEAIILISYLFSQGIWQFSQPHYGVDSWRL